MKSKDSNNKSMSPEERVEKLEAICKAFAFVLPMPAKTHNDCVTTSELYRMQHKMVKNMWVEYINSKTK